MHRRSGSEPASRARAHDGDGDGDWLAARSWAAWAQARTIPISSSQRHTWPKTKLSMSGTALAAGIALRCTASANASGCRRSTVTSAP